MLNKTVAGLEIKDGGTKGSAIECKQSSQHVRFGSVI